MNNSERTSNGSRLPEKVTAGLQQAKGQADSNNVLGTGFEGQSATPLFDQLVAGDFYCLHWKQFVSMCGRIAQEENVPWTDIHEYILAYLDENEPVDSWEYIVAGRDRGVNWNKISLLRALRKLLKSMPLSESERRAFKHWQTDFSLRTGKVPSFIQAMYDIIDGKYDNEPEEADRLMGIAIDELEKPDCDPRWEDVAHRASDHLTEIVLADAKAFGIELKAKNAAKKRQTEGRVKLRGDEPDWLIAMYDIIDGKYDNDTDEIDRLLDIAGEELEKPGCNPQWEEIANDAADHLTVLLLEQI